jgi:hypothetical protein
MLPNSKPDVSLINGYAGKYHKTLMGSLFLNSDIATTMTVIKNVTAPRTFVKMDTSAGLRQLNTAVKEAKGGRNFTPETITPRGGMKIIEVIPEDYRDTFLSEDLKEDAKKEPFVGFMLNEEFAKASEEYLLNFYDNEYVAPTAFNAAATYSVGDYALYDQVVYKCVTATNAAESPDTHSAKWLDADALVILDGPAIVISKAVSAGKLIPFATGAITESNACDKLLTQFKAHSSPMQKTKKVVHHISYDVFEKYQKDYNNRYGSGKGIGGADLDTSKAIVLRGSAGRCLLQPCDWMGDSQRVISCPKSFLIFTTSNDPSSTGMAKAIETIHGYIFTIKHLTGFGFRSFDGVIVNDQV